MLCSAGRRSARFLWISIFSAEQQKEAYVMAHDVTCENCEADVIDVEE